MVTKSGRRWALAAGLAFAWMLAAPSFAEAQGLLPDLPTRFRKKPPCASEPPFYSTVRHQFFGYYPTCWRRFPPGWTCPCPNPELPDFQASLAKQKLRLDSGEGAAGAGAGGDNGAVPGPNDPSASPDLPPADTMDLPDQPRGRSPFDTPDPKPATPPPLTPGDDSLDSERPKVPARGPTTSAVAPAAPVVVAAAADDAPAPAPTPRRATNLDLPPVAAATPEVAPLVEAGAPSPAGFEPPLETAAAPAEASAAAAQPLPTSAPPEDAAAAPMPSTPEPSIPATPAAAANNGSADPALAPPPLVQGTPAPASAPRRSIIGGVFNRFRRR